VAIAINGKGVLASIGGLDFEPLPDIFPAHEQMPFGHDQLLEEVSAGPRQCGDAEAVLVGEPACGNPAAPFLAFIYRRDSLRTRSAILKWRRRCRALQPVLDVCPRCPVQFFGDRQPKFAARHVPNVPSFPSVLGTAFYGSRSGPVATTFFPAMIRYDCFTGLLSKRNNRIIMDS